MTVDRDEAIDISSDRMFERVATMVAQQLSVPIVVICVEGANRSWFKAPDGFDAEQIDQIQRLCPPALSSRAEALQQPGTGLFAGYNFHAGVPLLGAEGRQLGSLCAFHTATRPVSPSEIALLEGLAWLVVDRLQLQRDVKDVARQKNSALALEHRALEENRLLSAMVQSSQDAIVTKTLDSTVTSWNAAAHRLFGFSASEMIGQSIRRVIPDDRSSEEDFVLASIARGEPIEHYETLRRHKDGHLIPISITVSPIRDDEGRIVGASKIARDITERRAREEHIRSLMREVNHRVKNQYAVILSMLRQTGRHAQTQTEFEFCIRERIMALSRSHDLLVERDWKGVTLADLVATQIAPLGSRDRFKVEGPPVMLSPTASQYLGMALHELATNSAQRGAMSGSDGSVSVVWSLQSRDGSPGLHLEWQEVDGPGIGQIADSGFGKLVLNRIAPEAVGGKGRIDTDQGHLTWTLDAPLSGVSDDLVHP